MDTQAGTKSRTPEADNRPKKKPSEQSEREASFSAFYEKWKDGSGKPTPSDLKNGGKIKPDSPNNPVTVFSANGKPTLCDSKNNSGKSGKYRYGIGKIPLNSGNIKPDSPNNPVTAFSVSSSNSVKTISSPAISDLISKTEKKRKIKTENSGKSGKTSGKSGAPPRPKTLKLTETEDKIIQLLSQGITNPKTLMSVLNCKKSAVYTHLKNLRKKGIIDTSNFLAEKYEGTLNPTTPPRTPEADHRPSDPAHPFKTKHQIRLHGQQFRIKILWSDHRYKELADKNKTITIDGNTVICNREVIQVHGVKTFIAETPFKVVAQSMEYYNNFFMKVQNDLKIILMKDRAQNVDMVRLKLGETNNEITADAELSGDRIRIYSKDDGKLWLDMDESYYLKELHFLHSHTAQQDAEQVTKQLNDFRDNKPPTITEVMGLLNDTVKTMQAGEKSHVETAAGLNAVVMYLKALLPNIATTNKQEPQQLTPEKPKFKDDYFGAYA